MIMWLRRTRDNTPSLNNSSEELLEHAPLVWSEAYSCADMGTGSVMTQPTMSFVLVLGNVMYEMKLCVNILYIYTYKGIMVLL